MGFEGTLRAGDEIEIHYATSLRTEPAGAERVAFRVGPWLLGAPADENPAYANELTLENRIRTETSGEAGATRSVCRRRKSSTFSSATERFHLVQQLAMMLCPEY